MMAKTSYYVKNGLEGIHNEKLILYLQSNKNFIHKIQINKFTTKQTAKKYGSKSRIIIHL
jgi:hypothetical protein